MTASGSYKLPDTQREAAAEVRRLASQARSGWEKEARMLSWFGVCDGMSVLELGSGPGFVTSQFLELLPTSPLTCLEVDRALLDQARQNLSDKANRRVQFVEASVMETGLQSNQFDIAYARYVFQHLPDPLGAAKEIWRVLKPGGKLVIFDIDDELFGVFEPPIPEFAPVLEAFGQAQKARGGDRHIGRKLWNILKGAGFGDVDLEVVATHTADNGVESVVQYISPERMLPLVEGGLLSEEDLERFRVALTRFLALPEAYTLWLSLMICAEKPALDG